MAQHGTPHTPTPPSRLFRRLGLASVVCVYLVILAGGIVRTTGSGMGCPDWPKCFGQLVPPTQESQLPANYREVYATEAHGVEPFNAAKTWTEYINRLLGALSGLLVLGLFLSSVLPRVTSIGRAVLAGFIVLLVGFQAWLGKLVVDSNLEQSTVTVHMLVAFLIVGLLLYTSFHHRLPRLAVPALGQRMWFLSWAALALVLVQVAMGTQVREGIDMAASRLGEAARPSWLASVGAIFPIHRSFSLVVLALEVFIISQLLKVPHASARRLAWALAGGTGLSIVLGIVLTYAGLPAWAQPLHLLIASLLVGAHIGLIMLLAKARKAAPVVASTVLKHKLHTQ